MAFNALALGERKMAQPLDAGATSGNHRDGPVAIGSDRSDLGVRVKLVQRLPQIRSSAGSACPYILTPE
ncbi:MAG TPA: hypothetical protein VM911_17310 [Pyrinomonadaceae bacterium]|nr:hypothetical protein [Pyrinomonadaceae bacterium]